MIIQIGEGENTVTLRIGEREITAAMIEEAINSLRLVLNETQALVSVKISNGAKFDSGFDVKEFAQLAKIMLKDGDIVQ